MNNSINKTSSRTKKAVWDSLLDMARYTRYYDTLTSKYRRYHHLLLFLLFSLSTIIATNEVTEFLPEYVVVIIAASIPVIIIWMLVFKPEEKAADLTLISRQVGKLEANNRILWEKVFINAVSDKNAMKELADIHKAVQEIAVGIVVDTDTKINQKCTEEAYQAESERYAITNA